MSGLNNNLDIRKNSMAFNQVTKCVRWGFEWVLILRIKILLDLKEMDNFICGPKHKEIESTLRTCTSKLNHLFLTMTYPIIHLTVIPARFFLYFRRRAQQSELIGK